MVDEDVACALWTSRYASPEYHLCDSEIEAADLAVGIQEHGNAAVLGIQFSDGRFIDVEDWPEYAEASRRHDEAFQEAFARRVAAPKPATRTVRLPFGGGRTATVLASDPEWIGLPE